MRRKCSHSAQGCRKEETGAYRFMPRDCAPISINPVPLGCSGRQTAYTLHQAGRCEWDIGTYPPCLHNHRSKSIILQIIQTVTLALRSLSVATEVIHHSSHTNKHLDCLLSGSSAMIWASRRLVTESPRETRVQQSFRRFWRRCLRYSNRTRPCLQTDCLQYTSSVPGTIVARLILSLLRSTESGTLCYSLWPQILLVQCYVAAQ